MRKKIKELMNKEEGFTLVELLAVIVILGIIVAIAVPMIGNVTDRAQSGADNAQKELAIDAAQLYMVENPDGVDNWSGTDNNTGSIDISTLEENGYLEKNEQLEGSVSVTRQPIEGEEDAYTYTYDAEKVNLKEDQQDG